MPSSCKLLRSKAALADWLLRTQKVAVNPDAMFDIQSKRLHEYKRCV